MSSAVDTPTRRAAATLGTFERYLTVWVALCIVAGIVLGRLLPAPFQALGRMTVAEVNIPVALLPVLCGAGLLVGMFAARPLVLTLPGNQPNPTRVSETGPASRAI